MPRLFTSLAIPRQTIAHLSLLRGGLPSARFIDPENYHLTLRFIGDVENHIADEIASALERVKCTPFSLKIESLDVFGGKRPHALYAKILPSLALTKLQEDIERTCQRLNLAPDGRKFTPHITLARLRDTTPQKAAHFLSNHGGINIAPFQVKEFQLLSSRDSIGGGPYIREEVYPFDPSQTIDTRQQTTIF